MTRKLLILILFILIFLSFSGAKKSSKNEKAHSNRKIVKQNAKPAISTPVKEDRILDSEALYKFGHDAAKCKVHSRMPQIDILNGIYRFYKNDPALLNGRLRLIIRGGDFSSAFARIEPLFNNPVKENDQNVLKSKLPPPEIKYSNFKNIILFCRDKEHRISIELNEAYTQELPYTFGAKIKLARNIEGSLRSDDSANVTEILFDTDKSVFFMAPGIAFFIPDVHSRIARIAVENNQIFGYVIGCPESAKERHVSVKYNLSTCAKSSIKMQELGPDEFLRKLSNVN